MDKENKNKLIEYLTLLSNFALKNPDKQSFAIGRIDGTRKMAELYNDKELSNYIDALRISIANGMSELVKNNIKIIEEYLFNKNN